MSDYDFRANGQVAAGARSQESILATNKVLKNTYMLLSMTLLFSAATAFVGMAVPIQLPWFLDLAVMFGLLFLVSATANSAMGIIAVFAFTGWFGFRLGPILNFSDCPA